MNARLQLLTRTALLLAVAVLLQWLGKLVGDALTLGVGTGVLVGSMVNLILLIAVIYCGLWGALAIGFFTPTIALFIGQLPSPLLIPFVGSANAILILSFFAMQKIAGQSRFVLQLGGIILGAVLKFVFMRYAIIALLPTLGLEKLIVPLTAAYGIVQLFAALIGGMLYFSVSAGLDRAKLDTAAKLLASVCLPTEEAVEAQPITSSAVADVEK